MKFKFGGLLLSANSCYVLVQILMHVSLKGLGGLNLVVHGGVERKCFVQHLYDL